MNRRVKNNIIYFLGVFLLCASGSSFSQTGQRLDFLETKDSLTISEEDLDKAMLAIKIAPQRLKIPPQAWLGLSISTEVLSLIYLSALNFEREWAEMEIGIADRELKTVDEKCPSKKTLMSQQEQFFGETLNERTLELAKKMRHSPEFKFLYQESSSELLEAILLYKGSSKTHKAQIRFNGEMPQVVKDLGYLESEFQSALKFNAKMEEYQTKRTSIQARKIYYEKNLERIQRLKPYVKGVAIVSAVGMVASILQMIFKKEDPSEDKWNRFKNMNLVELRNYLRSQPDTVLMLIKAGEITTDECED